MRTPAACDQRRCVSTRPSRIRDCARTRQTFARDAGTLDPPRATLVYKPVSCNTEGQTARIRAYQRVLDLGITRDSTNLARSRKRPEPPSKLMMRVRSRSAALLVGAGRGHCDDSALATLHVFIARISPRADATRLAVRADRASPENASAIKTSRSSTACWSATNRLTINEPSGCTVG
jgi:hypothetical protein